MAETSTTSTRRSTEIGPSNDAMTRIKRVTTRIDENTIGTNEDLSDHFDDYSKDEFVTKKFNTSHLGVLFDDHNILYDNVLNGLNFFVDEDGSLKISNRSQHIESEWFGTSDSRAGSAGDLVLQDFKTMSSLATLIDASDGIDSTEEANLVDIIRMLAHDTRDQKKTHFSADDFSNDVSDDMLDFLTNYLNTLSSKPSETNKESFYTMLKVIDKALATDMSNPDGINKLLSLKPDLNLWDAAYKLESHDKEATAKTPEEKIKLIQKAVEQLHGNVNVDNSVALTAAIKAGVSSKVDDSLAGITDLDEKSVRDLKKQVIEAAKKSALVRKSSEFLDANEMSDANRTMFENATAIIERASGNAAKQVQTTLTNLLKPYNEAKQATEAQKTQIAQQQAVATQVANQAAAIEAQEATRVMQEIKSPQDLLLKLRNAVTNNNGGTRGKQEFEYLTGELVRFIEGRTADYSKNFAQPDLASPSPLGIDVDPQLVNAIKLFLTQQPPARSLEQIFANNNMDTAVEEIYNTVNSPNFTHPDRAAFFDPNQQRIVLRPGAYSYNPAVNRGSHPLLSKLGIRDLLDLESSGIKFIGDVIDVDSIPKGLVDFMSSLNGGDQNQALSQISSFVIPNKDAPGKYWFDYSKFEQATAGKLITMQNSNQIGQFRNQLHSKGINVDEMFASVRVGRSKEELKKALTVFLHRIHLFNQHYNANIDPNNPSVNPWANRYYNGVTMPN